MAVTATLNSANPPVIIATGALQQMNDFALFYNTDGIRIDGLGILHGVMCLLETGTSNSPDINLSVVRLNPDNPMDYTIEISVNSPTVNNWNMCYVEIYVNSGIGDTFQFSSVNLTPVPKGSDGKSRGTKTLSMASVLQKGFFKRLLNSIFGKV
jgi:hypothetical protein